jgi:hypothetical protein
MEVRTMDLEKLRSAMVYDAIGAFEEFIESDSLMMLTSDQMEELLTAAGRNDGPAILCMAYPWVIDEEALASVIGGVWSGAEFPELALGFETWESLFAEAMYPGAPRWPKKTIRLWRGAPESRARGMSWTRDRELAEWFARRFEAIREPGFVWTAKAGSKDILCVINDEDGRNESEYVLDPTELTITRE